MPANAGIQVRSRSENKNPWIPACAGMTETEVDFQSTNSEPLGLEPRVVPFDPESVALRCRQQARARGLRRRRYVRE